MQCIFFSPVANITDDSKDFPTIPVAISVVCVVAAIVTVLVIVFVGIYCGYSEKKTIRLLVWPYEESLTKIWMASKRCIH